VHSGSRFFFDLSSSGGGEEEESSARAWERRSSAVASVMGNLMVVEVSKSSIAAGGECERR